jgi:hypothetical protein
MKLETFVCWNLCTFPRRTLALVTILDEAHPVVSAETALLSEPALAADWNRPEEDAAWSHLQRAS